MRGTTIRRRTQAKYGNRPTRCDGLLFASAKEARRWQELVLLARAGHINDLRRQVVWPLSVGTEIIGRYIADFGYVRPLVADRWDGPVEEVAEDCKGFRTPLYQWKAKHFAAQYGRKILET